MRISLLHRAALLGLVAALCLPVAALAQTAPLSYHMEPYALDTGLHAGQPGEAAHVAYSAVVEVPGAPWLRLSFSDADLGSGSYLTVTSLYDMAQQRLDAAGLAQWQNTSAYFNGEALLVELHVAPGDRGVFVRMDEVMVGEHGSPESQCGPTDDRTPSSDPPAGRLLSIGCTAWLIADGRFVSAGHCISSASSTNTVEFNVPPSLSNGTLQHPGPEDQYVVDDATRVFTNGGVGNDWGVFETLPNTETGLTALEAQGAFFNLAQDLGPATIRITGYGVDSGTANQTQQTHAGPNAGSSGTTMRYQTDTEGGNSGSPVIDEANDIAVGVHTHGGCSTSGGGNNSGTSTFNTAFWAQVGSAAGGLNVTCTPVDPPVVIPPDGGSFAYELDVTNNGTSSETFDVWIEMDGPGVSRTLGPFSRTLAAGASLTRTLTQRIPAGAPAGDYVHTCNVGAFPTAADSDSFDWAKLTSWPVPGGRVTAWTSDADLEAVLGPAVASASGEAPSAYVLEGAYPNPARATATIRYALPEAQAVRLAVYDLLGREVAVLVDEYREAGAHEAVFDGSRLGAGVYLYVIEAGPFSATRRVTLMK